MNQSKDNDGGSNTQRMQKVAGLQPAFTPGEFVYLNSAMPGFPDGTRFKVIAARSIGANQHRYELQGMGQTIWVLEADLRSTAPDSAVDLPPSRALSMTQRMQTMTLSQRMAALGLNNEDGPDNGSTQRLRILSNADPAVAPPPSGPITGDLHVEDSPSAPAAPAPKKPENK